VRVQEIAMSTSRDQNPGQVEQQATGATAGGKMSRTELNVLKTMITVILGFIICWTPASMSNLIQSLTVCLLKVYILFSLFGYVTIHRASLNRSDR